MSRTFKTEAAVLRKRSLLNKDLIITLFTEKYGKINVIAAGIKKITSRRLPHTQTGNLIKAVIYKKGERFYLQETQLISAFSQIKNNSKKIESLYHSFFVLERLLPENQRESPVYNLTKKFLINLSAAIADNRLILLKYLNRLMRLLGYAKEEKSLAELQLIIEEIIYEKIPSFNI